MWRTEVADLSPLRNCTGLTSIDMRETKVSDMSPLVNCIGLTNLNLSETDVTELSHLVNCTGLTNLNLSGTEVTDLSPLASCIALTWLDLWRTTVTDVYPLANCTSLTDINLMGTKVSDLSPLRNCTALTNLNLCTEVSDVSPLASCSALTNLNLWHTKVTDLSPLASCTGLTSLNLWNTKVADLSVIANCTRLTRLNLWGTKVSDLSALANYTALIDLNLWGTKVTDLYPLRNCIRLISIDLSYTEVADLYPLRDCIRLININLMGTEVADLSPLRDCIGLINLNLTNTKVIVDFVQSQDLLQELIWAEKNAPLTYDGWIADSTTVVDIMSNTKMLASIDSLIRADTALQWPDVLDTYAGNIVGVPISNSPFFLYYRKDLFAMIGLGAPTTWEDVMLAAKMLNGSDFNLDGTPDHALCIQFEECIDGPLMASLILASMTQAAGTKTGYLFDPQTMQTFVGSAAMVETMDLMAEMTKYSAKGCQPVSPDFMAGACALTMSVDALFKVVQLNSPIRDLYGVANPPGSLRVLNRQTGRLEECTQKLCPYAKLQRTYDGRERRVNQVQFGTGGESGFTNAHQEPVYRQAMHDFFSFLSEPTRSKQRVIGTYFSGPFRKSHLDTSPASLAKWSAAGYNPDAVKELLVMMQADNPNNVMNLRMRGGSSFVTAFGPAIRNASAGMAPTTIAENLAAEYAAILAQSGTIDEVRASLWAGLGIPLPAPPPPPAVVTSSGSSSGPPLGLIIGVTIPVTIAVLALVVLFVIMRSSKRSLFGQHWILAAGDETTLVVTDIMDSTALWETLDGGGMARAVAMHHSVIRKAVSRFHGYEQATEGDSFLLAFHTPSNALGFAVQVQASLLAADWDAELLEHPSCAPVTMVQSKELVSAGGGDGRFHLGSVAAVLEGVGEGLAGRLLRRFSTKGTQSARVSEVGTLPTAMPRRHSLHVSALGQEESARNMGAARAAGSSVASHEGTGGDGGAATAAPPPEADALVPAVRLASESAAVSGVVRFAAAGAAAAPPLRESEPSDSKVGPGGGDAAAVVHPPRVGEASSAKCRRNSSCVAADEPSALLFPAGEGGLESMLVLKGGAHMKRGLRRGTTLSWRDDFAAAADGGTQRDVCRFQLAHALARLEDVHVAAAPSALFFTPSAPDTERGTTTMGEYMRMVFDEDDGAHGATLVPKGKGQVDVVFRGLRVRVGMHSGVTKTDTERNSTAGRMSFTGMPLALAKAVGDVGASGMIVMTQEAFGRLNPVRALSDVLVLCLGEHQVRNDGSDPVSLHQAIDRKLVPRLAVFEELRNVKKLQLSVLDAPLGSNVTIAFANMVSISSLQAWNKDQADTALSTFVALSTPLLHKAGGYLVELTSSGLCLAAFREPASAVAWGLCLIEVMKHADWDEELLAHELCQEVLVQASAPAGQPPPRGAPAAHNVLFRGPRLKIGIDVGRVQADVSPVTGRMAYRGKVMNRAARICGKASSGMQWCSAAVWDQVVSTCGEQLPSTGILSTELGAFGLKGISDSVHLVQNALGGGSAPMAVQPEGRAFRASCDALDRRTPLLARASHTSVLARVPSVLARVPSALEHPRLLMEPAPAPLVYDAAGSRAPPALERAPLVSRPPAPAAQPLYHGGPPPPPRASPSSRAHATLADLCGDDNSGGIASEGALWSLPPPPLMHIFGSLAGSGSIADSSEMADAPSTP
ncbi:hypothetical protein FOA52_014467 [Chlamydomonas sp. UWO 241]|nr:hypothetical protein FOA52_014467 [Chlamydomonas sp. UWO 241]